MDILYIVFGIIIGLIVGWIIATFKTKSESGKIEERASMLDQSKKELETKLSNESNKVLELNSKLSSLTSDYNNLQQKLAEQKGDIEELQHKFTKEFENLANKIFEEKGNKFSEQNKEKLNEILNPLKEKISEFEKKVEENSKESIKGHASLKEQLQMLKELNQQITQEAKNLTEALKGQSKTQGNWGEFILESLLEKSGLVKNREYTVQESLTVESGRRFQPDVIIKLPENKSIVIDSKVSLVAYEKFSSTENENDRLNAIREHILSIRNHIKNLSGKNYQNLYGINSLDFVLMFLPIESAFSLALQNDSGLFQEAYDKNIVIVSPTTLLATLRTIASIWRQENQNKNALEIARQSGALYDKFVGFVEDLQTIGSRIEQTQSAYSDAMKKLSTGRGNLLNSAEKIRKLGAKASKTLPQSLIEDDDNLLEE